MAPTTVDDVESRLPAGVDAAQLDRLLRLRETLIEEREEASSPAVARALQMADYYLFLGLTCFGYSEKLFPEQV
jgi:hypothetical protein